MFYSGWLPPPLQVSQEPVLFATTIRENIMFGRDGVSGEEVERAARQANAHSFISQLPEVSTSRDQRQAK